LQEKNAERGGEGGGEKGCRKDRLSEEKKEWGPLIWEREGGIRWWGKNRVDEKKEKKMANQEVNEGVGLK